VAEHAEHAHDVDEARWVLPRAWVPRALIGFLVGIVYFVWFVVVLIGESQRWTDDPAAWALLPTAAWAFIGIAIFILLGAWFLALLVRREVPPRVFVVQDNGHVREKYRPVAAPRAREDAPEPEATGTQEQEVEEVPQEQDPDDFYGWGPPEGASEDEDDERA
jgi:fatty acid desaturase